MVTENTKWHHAVPGQLISSSDVHIWRMLLDEHSSHIESIKRNLSTDELLRAEKFYFEKDQNRFIMARGILRIILAGYLGMKPHEIRFEYTPFGKPQVAEKNDNESIHFNLSQSENVVLYAITLNRNIGIDVERIKDSIDVVQVANRFFSPGEINALKRCNRENLAEIFFQYWTRKEALIKAMGKGVSFPLEQIDVTLINGKTLSPIKIITSINDDSDWHIQDLFPAAGYKAAIAVEKRDLDISYWDYKLD